MYVASAVVLWVRIPLSFNVSLLGTAQSHWDIFTTKNLLADQVSSRIIDSRKLDPCQSIPDGSGILCQAAKNDQPRAESRFHVWDACNSNGQDHRENECDGCADSDAFEHGKGLSDWSPHEQRTGNGDHVAEREQDTKRSTIAVSGAVCKT